MSKIQQALAKATEIEPKKDESIKSESYLKRLALGVQDLPDAAWNKLPVEVQDWVNEASDAINAKKPPPVFPDYKDEEPAEEAPARRRRSAVEEEPEAAKVTEYKPAKGDSVIITTKRGKQIEAVIVDPDDKGELVYEDAEGEAGLALDRIQSILPVKTVKEEPSSRRRRAADEEEPAEPAAPEVSDTVEVTTARDKVHTGNVLEISDDTLVITTASGEELEFDRAKLKSVKVKVKNAKPAGRARTGAAEPEKTDKKEKAGKVTKEENGGVSVTTRARELMCDDLSASVEDIGKLLKKEGLEFKENTIQLIHRDVQKLVGMLKARKMMK